MRVTTIALTDEMHRQLAIEALDRRTVLTQLVREAISEWLERQGRKSKPSRRAK
jgi:predicted transcriptional regulator